MSTDATTETTVKPTLSDTLNSLTGYEEDEIEHAFGNSVYNLIGPNFVKGNRALAYVLQRRAGKKGSEALKIAKSMTSGDLNDIFADDDEDDDEVMPDEPVTEAGKDDSASE